MSIFKITISKKNEKITLKEWLKTFRVGKNKLNYLIDNSKIKINNEIIKNREYILNYEDNIEIDTSIYDEIDYPGVRSNLRIIYEDEYLLVVDKPKGVIIYPENKEKSQTMANYIAYYYNKTNQNHAVRHIHRLDEETTGCLVYAKDIFTHSLLDYAFSSHNVKKEYLCVVCGIIDNRGIVNAKIGRNRHNSNQMIITNNGLNALTLYEPIEKRVNSTVLKVEIKTGRTHQIRVHLASIGHPLIGDMLYGSNIDGEMILHCSHIGLIHPITKQWIDFYSKNPKNLNI